MTNIRNDHFAPPLIVYGSAWGIPDTEAPGYLIGCREAVRMGWSILSNGGSALDAVETAIRSRKDDPAMEHTPHVFIAGAGVEKSTQAQGLPLCDAAKLLTGHELERWRMIKAQPNFAIEEAFSGNRS